MNINLETIDDFMALLEALTQYTDNARELEEHELETYMGQGVIERFKAAERLQSLLEERLERVAG